MEFRVSGSEKITGFLASSTVLLNFQYRIVKVITIEEVTCILIKSEKYLL